MGQKRVIAHLDMDAFFAAVEQRDNPALRGKPVIVGSDPKEGKGRGVVATCSYEARAFGIHSAMPISQAYKRCPNGVYLRGNGKKYSAVSKQIFQILESFTADIQPVSIDEAFLDLTTSYHLFGSPLDAGKKIKDAVKKNTGLVASIGIAPNKMIAKIASDYDKPDGLFEVTEENKLDFLWPLDISRIWGVGKKTEEKLKREGFVTVGDLARADESYLAKKYGSHGKSLYLKAHGIDFREVEIDDETKSVSNEHTFEKDTADVKEIKASLSYLSEKVSRRLRKKGLKGRTISVKIRTDNFKTYTRAQTVSSRINYYNEIFKVALDLLKDFYVKEMKLRLIGVRVSNLEDGFVQDSLFEDTTENQKKEAVHKVIDQIKDKYGESSIHRGF